jgi:hypothetical protein
MSTGADEEKAEEVHCHDCGFLASSSEEARANAFCHVKVFDARRRVVVGGDDDEDQQKAAGGLKDGYYWLCPDCFHHMLETLLVVSGDFCNNFLRYRQDLEKEGGEEAGSV